MKAIFSLCVFFGNQLQKERGRWLKPYNLFWTALSAFQRWFRIENRTILGWVTAIFVKIVEVLHKNGCISLNNAPISNPKPPFESSWRALSPLKMRGVRLLEHVR